MFLPPDHRLALLPFLVASPELLRGLHPLRVRRLFDRRPFQVLRGGLPLSLPVRRRERDGFVVAESVKDKAAMDALVNVGHTAECSRKRR